MINTRLVTIKTVDSDNMLLTLYYGLKQADKAMIRGVAAASHDELLELIEQFKMYGVGDE